MRDIEVKLRRGMEHNGIAPGAQEQIINSITSFALYGFPESHAASFALLAYASAYLKCHYLAAFTAALLNNQPMGFYAPSTIVKDAQRHGLKIKPIDVMKSDWLCTIEEVSTSHSKPETRNCLRLGLRYAKGLREEAAQAMVRERQKRPFTSIEDLVQRVPELRRNELVLLAEIGALNSIKTSEQVSSFELQLSEPDFSVSPSLRGELHSKLHRREALWQVELALRPAGPLLEGAVEQISSSPLARMNDEERLVADFRGTGMTVGPHPMSYHRAEMHAQGVRAAIDLKQLPNGKYVRVAGGVIARQRPGTAHGFVFLSLEDETGVANAIITPDLFEKNRILLVREQFLLIEGKLQNLDNVISVKADRVLP